MTRGKRNSSGYAGEDPTADRTSEDWALPPQSKSLAESEQAQDSMNGPRIEIEVFLQHFARVRIGLKDDYVPCLSAQRRHQNAVHAIMCANIEGSVSFDEASAE